MNVGGGGAEAREAVLYDKQPDGRVRCNLCAYRCIIQPGRKGVCRVRANYGGTLRTLVYGRTISQAVDPVEKKPLYHFHPGSSSFSIATPGCNYRCRWCQNAEISQMPRERHLIMGKKATPHDIAAAAKRADCRSIAYTYTEPTIFFEYAYDTAKKARRLGISNLFVTNGYMTIEALEMISPYLDGANVDLKAYSDDTYRKYVKARLQPVLDSLQAMKRLGIWIEVTTLIIPGINDDAEELKRIAGFIAGELGADTPWHISRFFPHFRMMDTAQTPLETLRTARELGRSEGLHHVYIGNSPEPEGQNTHCPDCAALLIRRSGYGVIKNVIVEGRCPQCRGAIAGVGMDGQA
jgi:pyruvate formate lyase activating enzyme